MKIPQKMENDELFLLLSRYGRRERSRDDRFNIDAEKARKIWAEFQSAKGAENEN